MIFTFERLIVKLIFLLLKAKMIFEIFSFKLLLWKACNCFLKYLVLNCYFEVWTLNCYNELLLFTFLRFIRHLVTRSNFTRSKMANCLQDRKYLDFRSCKKNTYDLVFWPCEIRPSDSHAFVLWSFWVKW
jgi:hypothetical protein